MSITHLSEQNFDEVLEQNENVIIDFWAKWCKPCVSFSKVMEELSPKNDDFTFSSIDIEEQPQLAKEFNIRSVPTILILRKRVIVYDQTGALGAVALQDLLDKARELSDKELASMMQSDE